LTTLPPRSCANPGDDDSPSLPEWLVVVSLGADPSSPPDALERLSTMHVWARWAVASNPACPAHLLEALARDSAPLVRRAVAQNAATPGAIVELLLSDPDERVRYWKSP